MSFLHDVDPAARVLRNLNKQNQKILMDQLNELTSRGLLVIESTQPTLYVEDGEMKLGQSVKLVLKDQEYIKTLEDKVEKLEERLKSIKEAIK